MIIDLAVHLQIVFEASVMFEGKGEVAIDEVFVEDEDCLYSETGILVIWNR